MINPNNKLDITEKSVSTGDPIKKENDHKTPEHKTVDPKNPDHKTPEHKTVDPKNPDTKSMSSQQGFKGLSNHDNKCDTNKDIKK